MISLFDSLPMDCQGGQKDRNDLIAGAGNKCTELPLGETVRWAIRGIQPLCRLSREGRETEHDGFDTWLDARR
jgi:hypothetical protein